MKRALAAIALLLTLIMSACGGGGNSGSVAPPPPPPASLTITGNAQLPDAVQGQPYSITLSATNGQGTLTWSISAISSTTLFVDGLTIDPATGTLSGTPTFWGTAQFYASVSDANSHTAWKSFSINGWGKLAAGAPNNFTFSQYQNIYFGQLNVQGGKPPLSFTLASGSLPPGVRINSQGQITGSPLQSGSFTAGIQVQDSWSNPQSVVQTVNFNVPIPGLNLATNLDNSSYTGNMLVNKPSNIALFASGGVPPYTYSLMYGNAPAGLSLDSSTGRFMGSPTTVGNTQLYGKVQDSVGTSAMISLGFYVIASRGRNDSVQTASAISNGSFAGSLSPYIDPPDKAPIASDTDYYKITTMAGSVVRVLMAQQSSVLDPVLEIVDANGIQRTTCSPSDSNQTTFASACLNDDDSSGTHSATLYYKVPGAAAEIVTSYIHALDWSGNARPDMLYYLYVSGNIEPSYVTLAVTRGPAYSTQVSLPSIAAYPATWTLDNGSLPDGLALSDTGTISGTATTDGTYSFRLKAVDSYTPAQTFYVFVTMTVGAPIKISNAGTLPAACVNKPYSYTMTSTGGVAPVRWFLSNTGPWGIGIDMSTGVFTGTPTTTGTFTGSVGALDAAGSTDWESVSFTVQTCP